MKKTGTAKTSGMVASTAGIARRVQSRVSNAPRYITGVSDAYEAVVREEDFDLIRSSGRWEKVASDKHPREKRGLGTRSDLPNVVAGLETVSFKVR